MPEDREEPISDKSPDDVVEYYKRLISTALDEMDLASVRDLVKEIEDECGASASGNASANAPTIEPP